MSTIDWQADWLYELILREAEELWRWCKPGEDSWQYVLIEERAAEEGGHYIGNVVRSWIRDANGLREISISEHTEHVEKIEDGIFPFIIMGFYIFPNRQHVIIGHQEGSRSGMGNEFIVQLDGGNANLKLDTHGSGWVS